jgi:hypothetical protein
MRETWTDFRGRSWPVTTSASRLRFELPCHAALRVHVFHRDGYRCCRCGAAAHQAPANYDGRDALLTDTFTAPGRRDVLLLDHVVTLKAGGRSVVENLQTLCFSCNRKKQREDRAAAKAFREAGARV